MNHTTKLGKSDHAEIKTKGQHHKIIIGVYVEENDHGVRISNFLGS